MFANRRQPQQQLLLWSTLLSHVFIVSYQVTDFARVLAQ